MKNAMPHERTPMTIQIECLASQGYTDEFVITNEGLKSIETEQVFQPEDIQIVEHRRFEGISDPDDMAILFIIKTKTGLKGTVVDAFGIYGNTDLMEFMNKAEDHALDSHYESDVVKEFDKCSERLDEKL